MTMMMISVAVLAAGLGLVLGFTLRFVLRRRKTQQAAEDDSAVQFAVIKNELESTRKQLTETVAQKTDLEQALATANQNLAAAKALENAQKQNQIAFENLANKIFEEKNKTFREESKENLDNLLKPLKGEISDFKTQITGFKAINDRMTSETENLTKALTSSVKAQGNWGEWNLERILENSGLRKGEGYIVQGEGMEIKSRQDGGRQMPDVVVHLPENKHIIIDSKVSLKSYVDYINAETDDHRQAHAKDFIRSLEAHIRGLEGKRYQDADGLNTPDFVMLFMPIEASYFLAMQEKEDLLGMAWDRKITLVCPSTLSASLRTIASLWRLEKQNKNAEDIARVAGAIYDKVHGFIGNMNDVGKAIEKAQEVHESAVKQLSSGRGNVLTQTEKLKELGAKTSKQLPQNLLEDGSD